ncbi:hypothetical protein FACS18942_02100 [Planctomycetales bacterium]|nr:hypothetical protein FACS18942_02100 [Planctomycetales bacterium]
MIEKNKWLLYSNIIINYFDKIPSAVRIFSEIKDDVLYFSVITRIELLSYSKNTERSEQIIRDFLSLLTPVMLDADVETAAIRLRQTNRLKLPDAVIAASAIVVNAVLITGDEQLASADFAGFRAVVPK